MSHLNLLPLGYRCRQAGWRRLQRWCIVWALALVVLGSLAWHQGSSYTTGYRRLVKLQHQSIPANKTNRQIANIRQIIQDIQQRESLVLELADEESMYALVAVLSRAARASAGRVSIQSLHVERRTAEQGSVNVAALSGLAVDNQDIATFVDELRRVEAFRRVELKNSVITNHNDIETRTYRLECVF